MIAHPWLLLDWHTAYCSERDLSLRTKLFYLGAARQYEMWRGRPLRLTEAAEGLNDYLDHLATRRNRYTARSIRAGLVVLLRAAATEGLCQLPKRVRPIGAPDHRPRGFLVQELVTLLKHASPLQAAGIHLAYDTGLRRSDLFAVRWPQVFGAPDDRRIAHTAFKTGRRVVRRMRNETVSALEAIRNPSDDRLLPSRVGYTGWRRQWQALGLRAAVDTKRRGLQAIRRTGASLTKLRGGSAAEYLGHSPQSSGLADRYYIDPELVDEAPPLPPPLE